jgi:hypothetical protein
LAIAFIESSVSGGRAEFFFKYLLHGNCQHQTATDSIDFGPRCDRLQRSADIHARPPDGQQDVPMTNNEDTILQHAEIIVDAVALGQAMLKGDIQEARFRARLITTNADIAGLSDVGRAASRVVDLLGRGPTAPRPGYGQAIEALSVAIDRAQPFG